MNPQIEQLHQIGQQPSRTVIGLMSGTSLDGLDIACCEFAGSGEKTRFKLQHFTSVAYSAGEQEMIRRVFAKADAPLSDVCLVHTWLGKLHGNMVKKAMDEWELKAGSVDLIASHGQTVFHAPQRNHPLDQFGNSTLQLGDGDQIASICGVITVADFRQKHIAAGGEGAPLAVYGDFLLLNKPGVCRYLINIGGISNFTRLPAHEKDKIFATDAGPGNTLSDAVVRMHHPGMNCDLGGKLALAGQVLPRLLGLMKDDPFFQAPVPKTTGPELFSPAWLQAVLNRYTAATPSLNDLLATLSQLVADAIFEALVANGADAGATYYLSGGGLYNEAITTRLRAKARWLNDLDSTAAIGLPPDAKEAALFAALANEAIAGDFSKLASRFGELPAVNFGKISLPC